MPLKTSDEKQDLILKVFDYFEAESKLSLGESEMNISCMLTFKRYKMASNYDIHSAPCIRAMSYVGGNIGFPVVKPNQSRLERTS
jgi:hypothetical protein